MYLLVMDLKTYIDSHDRLKRSAVREVIARHVGVSESTVRSWVSGNRNIHPKRFKLVKEATEGKVTIFRTDMSSQLPPSE